MLTQEFLNSIVWIDKFDLSKSMLSIELLCIEKNIDVKYNLTFIEIIYFVFRQEDYEEEFSVIDTFLERFNESTYVDFMKSEKRKDYWIMRFHSGIHHLLVGFKEYKLNKL